ncbi:MAG TPA: ATP-binding protein [Coxiellaceae bacterium]|nr:MAG: hypothetical protein A3E81_08020 [Gammaproteobacteria bacterium RIFCSPHIGHO2_12_FULL_36_30]HLB57105.1 ATP-binding protein [Coxiellaceae bacterium]
MKRHIFNQLQKWRQSTSRKPLILQGARQVGKTYIVESFAQSEFENYAYVNFEQDDRAKQIFEQDLKPHRIIKALELHLSIQITAENTLIFFDEIQACPNALNSLKYFCEQAKEYFVVAAGSLLGIKLSNDKGFPVGKVNFLELYPMSFFEFLQALGKENLSTYLTEINNFEPLNSAIHDDLCDLLKIYLYVGGMPEAVKTYIKKENFSGVRKAHEEIIKAYLLDFSKHAPDNQIMKITTIWNSLPDQLAKENKKFVFSTMKSGARAREYEIALQWLIDAGLIYISYNITTPKLPLKAYLDHNAFKIYCLDVGILGALSDLDAQILLDKNALFTEFKGALTENLAAQLLKCNGMQHLFYWTSAHTAEVDFIVPFQNNILPLEIKSGTSTKKKSLMVYDEKYQPDILNRAGLLNLKKDGKLCNYPLYLLERFPISD